MSPVLRKGAQLNIKYRRKRGPIIDVCTGAPPGEVTALLHTHFHPKICVLKMLLIKISRQKTPVNCLDFGTFRFSTYYNYFVLSNEMFLP